MCSSDLLNLPSMLASIHPAFHPFKCPFTHPSILLSILSVLFPSFQTFHLSIIPSILLFHPYSLSSIQHSIHTPNQRYFNPFKLPSHAFIFSSIYTSIHSNFRPSILLFIQTSIHLSIPPDILSVAHLYRGQVVSL